MVLHCGEKVLHELIQSLCAAVASSVDVVAAVPVLLAELVLVALVVEDESMPNPIWLRAP